MHSMRHMLKLLPGVFVGSLLFVPATTFAQLPDKTGPTAERRETTDIREADLENREIRLRLLSDPSMTSNRSSEDERKLVVKQILEDFEGLQTANREMIKVNSKLDPSAYKRISSLADDINKRAKRLKTNLAIPDWKSDKPEAEPAVATDAPQLKASVGALNTSVTSFVTNQFFKDPRVATIGQLHNLRRDISSVIELSQLVKKGASKLH
ncbi:MAG TPA: hypothetical protein VF088_13150 [Pyrinomonadaceae bacterium]